MIIVRGEKRHKPGRWVLDYRDSFGKRRWKVFRTRQEAEDFAAQARLESRHRRHPTMPPDVTIAEYSAVWLKRLAARCKLRTVQSAANTLRLHVLPVFGTERVRRLDRAPIVDWLSQLLARGLSRNTVRLCHATLRGLLTDAVEVDGLLPTNPAGGDTAKRLRLVVSPRARAEAVKAMSRAQLAGFLEACRTHRDAYVRRLYPFFLLMARTGLRLGEGLALQWGDLDWTGRALRVERGFSGGRLETPKSGHGRTVDLSQQTLDVLRKLRGKRAAECLRRAWGELPVWIFPNEAGQPMDEHNLRKTFSKGLKAAGLPHFTPHSLRHTFASLLLQAGESPAYVQAQLGHGSITLTVDLYGKWLPQTNKAAVDRLDDAAAPRDLLISVAAAAGPVPVAAGTQPVANGSQPVAKAVATMGPARVTPRNYESRRWDSNPRPADYESAALPLSYTGPSEPYPITQPITRQRGEPVRLCQPLW